MRALWRHGALANWLGQDARFAARILVKRRQTTLLSVLTLALGLGAGAAAFKAAQAWLIRPLVIPDPARLVRVDGRHVRGNGTRYRDFLDWRARNRVFDDIAIVAAVNGTLSERDGASSITNCAATVSTPRVLGIAPMLGRFFTAEEDAPGGERVALVSEAAWVRRFGRRPDIIGSRITLNETAHTIIGVMPDRAVLPSMQSPEFWLPLRADPSGPRIGQQYYGVYARLKPGVSLRAAQADMDAIARALEQEYPDSNRGWQVSVVSAQAFIREKAIVPVVAVLAIALCLLLMVTANVGGILLARTSGRLNEIAVRSALGASRWRVVRQFLTESVALGMLGGAGAVLVTYWLLRGAAAFMPGTNLERALHLDWTVIVFTFGLSVATGLLFGVPSALQGTRTDLATVLQASGSRADGPWRRGRLLPALVIAEIALSLVLLVGGGLLTRDVLRLLATDTGVDAAHVLTFSVELPKRYAATDERIAFPSSVIERLAALPGVEAAAAIDTLPMSGFKTAGRFSIGQTTGDSKAELPAAIFHASTPRYGRTIGIPVLQGRDFTTLDRWGAPLVVLVSRTLVEKYFSGSEAIGQQVVLSDGEPRTIVGIVGDVRHDGPRRRPSPEIYLPLAQSPARELFFVLRSATDPKTLPAAVRAVVREVDPLVAVDQLRTMDAVIADSLSQPRQLSAIVGGFALFGLLLAGTGLYGLISFSVGRRRHEIGIRMAMGASPTSVHRLILRNGLVLAACGLLAGMPLAYAFAWTLRTILALTSPRDVVIFTGMPLVVLAVALTAAYIPARRATRLPPSVALRCD